MGFPKNWRNRAKRNVSSHRFCPFVNSQRAIAEHRCFRYGFVEDRTVCRRGRDLTWVVRHSELGRLQLNDPSIADNPADTGQSVKRCQYARRKFWQPNNIPSLIERNGTFSRFAAANCREATFPEVGRIRASLIFVILLRRPDRATFGDSTFFPVRHVRLISPLVNPFLLICREFRDKLISRRPINVAGQCRPEGDDNVCNRRE